LSVTLNPTIAQLGWLWRMSWFDNWCSRIFCG